MKIAVLCFGSIYWDKGSLKTLGEWKSDGPELPLEFCRISSPGKSKERLTLVVNETSANCVTYWDVLVANDLKVARNSLRDREGAVTDDIHTFTKNQNPLSVSAVQIDTWLKQHPDIDAVVWSGVESNWEKIRHAKFSEKSLLQYLDSKKQSIEKIKEVFDRTPPQLKTLGRDVYDQWSKKNVN